jgi:coenzyme F420-dependent oxidoreductase
MSSRQAKLEVTLPVAAADHISDLLEYGTLADERGYDHVWISETWGRDLVTVLAALSERTKDVGLGTSIMPTFSRSPALVGQTAATLQELSGGRFRLGLGPSGPKVIEQWHGMEYERPLRRTREYLEIAGMVVAGEQVEYDGDFFDLSGFRLRFDLSEAPPDIDVAGMGPTAVEMAGRFADGWHALMPTTDGFAERLDDLERGVEMADRDRETVDARVFAPTLALKDGDRARSLVRLHIAFYVGGMGPFYRNALSRQGYEAEAERIADLWQSGEHESAAAEIDDAMLDDIAIAGTPTEARAACDAVRERDGVDAVSLLFPVRATKEDMLATIKHLAPDWAENE